MAHFLSAEVLLDGGPYRLPVQIERLLWHLGFDDVRVIDGANDQGGDILATRNGERFVLQSKWKRTGAVPSGAVDEAENAKRHYACDRAVVVTNSLLAPSTIKRAQQLRTIGSPVETWDGRALRRLHDAIPDRLPSVKLRDYQENALAALRRDLDAHGRALLILATGLGKTVIGGEVIRHYIDEHLGDAVLVVAHLTELVRQLEKAMWRHLPKTVKTEVLTGNEKPADLSGVTFATVESAMRVVRDERYAPKLIMVDETHHVSEDGSFQELLDLLRHSRQFGVTATPWRGDKYDITHRFGPASSTMGIAEGMAKGWLAQVDYRLYVDNIDWEVVGAASRRSYSIKELNEKLFLPQRDEAIVDHLADAYTSIAEPRGIVFCQTIEHAERFANTLRKTSPLWRNARCLHSGLNRQERQQALSDFRLGRIPLIAVRDIFNEGVDVPDVNIICFLRVTHSRRIFVQQLGRGLRLKGNDKRVLVLDFVTDIRRAAAALGIKREMERFAVEEVTMPAPATIEFSDADVGTLMDAWMKDAADLETSAAEIELQFPEVEWNIQ